MHTIKSTIKHIFIVYLFDIINTNIFTYMFSQTLNTSNGKEYTYKYVLFGAEVSIVQVVIVI
jgi:hypothetical protein